MEKRFLLSLTIITFVLVFVRQIVLLDTQKTVRRGDVDVPTYSGDNLADAILFSECIENGDVSPLMHNAEFYFTLDTHAYYSPSSFYSQDNLLAARLGKEFMIPRVFRNGEIILDSNKCYVPVLLYDIVLDVLMIGTTEEIGLWHSFESVFNTGLTALLKSHAENGFILFFVAGESIYDAGLWASDGKIVIDIDDMSFCDPLTFMSESGLDGGDFTFDELMNSLADFGNEHSFSKAIQSKSDYGTISEKLNELKKIYDPDEPQTTEAIFTP